MDKPLRSEYADGVKGDAQHFRDYCKWKQYNKGIYSPAITKHREKRPRREDFNDDRKGGVLFAQMYTTWLNVLGRLESKALEGEIWKRRGIVQKQELQQAGPEKFARLVALVVGGTGLGR